MKVTKKQAKKLRGPNAAVRRSLEDGHQYGDYIGANPLCRAG